MIVQELNAIQSRCGYLPKDELHSLSQRTNTPVKRLHEVASSFPHYRLEPPPLVDVRVCRDMSCHLAGACRVRDSLQSLANELGHRQVHVDGVSCLGQCDGTVAVTINDQVFWGKPENELRDLVRRAAREESLPHQHGDRGSLGWEIDPYQGKPEYKVIQQFVKTRDGDAILATLEEGGLVGMGGAAFPTHLKWKFVRDAPGDTKYVVVNGDESEPGTFKDRELLRRTPWLIIEGTVVAGLLAGAEKGYVYIRHEFHEQIDVMKEAIADARERGFCGMNILGSELNMDVEVFTSPGGYICGEESALLEAMEDRAAQPRNKPPFPVTHGLYSKPTVLNNVETLAWVPSILLKGGPWYRDAGVNGSKGMRLFSISGDVKRPGVYEVRQGLTVRELVEEHAGGMIEGQSMKALATSGPSGGVLPAHIPRSLIPDKFASEHMSGDAQSFDIMDLRLDPGVIRALGGMLGAAIVVIGHKACIVDFALNCVEFYRNESCGKCVPCRVGSQKLVDIITEVTLGRARAEQMEIVDVLAETMREASICGLGMVASNPFTTVMKYFGDELKEHVDHGRCAAGVCSPN